MSDLGPSGVSVTPVDEGGLRVRIMLSGELDLSTVGSLEAVLEEHQGSGRSVVVDLSQLRFMDSSGLHVLLSAQNDARRDGWTFVVAGNVSAPVGRLIELSGTRQLFDWA